jgi:hypothetical protein
MATSKHGEKCSICRVGLQVPLLTEREGFVRPASQSSTTIDDVLMHMLGSDVMGGPGTQGGIQSLFEGSPQNQVDVDYAWASAAQKQMKHIRMFVLEEEEEINRFHPNPRKHQR